MFRKYFRKFFTLEHEKKTGLNECACNFSVDYKTFDSSYIMDIHKYLMKKHNIKQCLG